MMSIKSFHQIVNMIADEFPKETLRMGIMFQILLKERRLMNRVP